MSFGFGFGLPAIRSSSPPYGPEVTAYIANVTAQGATVLPGVAASLDTMVKGLKTDGTWSSITDLHIACGVSTVAGACVKLVSSNASYLVTATNYNTSTYQPSYIPTGVDAGFNKYANLKYTILQAPVPLPTSITAPAINFPSVCAWGVFGDAFNSTYLGAQAPGGMGLYSESATSQKIQAYSNYSGADYVQTAGTSSVVCGGDIIAARESGKLTIQACNVAPAISTGGQSAAIGLRGVNLVQTLAAWFSATGLTFAQTQSVRDRIKTCLTSPAIGRIYGVNAFYYYGDSLTAGDNYGGQISWPNQLVSQSTYPSWVGKQVNTAAISSTAGTLATNTAAYENTILQTAPSQYQPKTISLVFYGTNDLGGGASAATVLGYLQSIWSRVKSTNGKVVAFTIAPRADSGWTAAKEIERVALNASIVAASANYDALVDVTSISQLSDPNNATYFQSDKLHFTTAGQTALANYVYSTINPNTI